MVRASRATKQKELIRQEVEKTTSFFSAADLHARSTLQNIGMATIYRYLAEAVKNGELHTYTCNRKSVYSKGKRSHCHFECEKTGKVIHFDIDNIDFLKNKIPGSITSFQLEVKGICDKCDK